MTMLPDDRMHRVWILAGLTFVGITIAIWTLKHEANQATTLAQANEIAITTLAGALEAEQQAAVEEGREPVAPSVEELIGQLGLEQRVADQIAEVIDDLGGIRGPAGPPGVAGPPPSQESVRVAVALYCSVDDRCQGTRGQQGPQGEPGVAGPAPTPEQVAEAVAEFCSGGACTGPQGAQGPVGESDPPPTEGQIAAAVTTYCSNNDCTGPQGPVGEDGARGPAGPQGPRGPAGESGDTIVDVRFVERGRAPPVCLMVLEMEGPGDPADLEVEVSRDLCG